MISILGLGAMGSRMAANLMKAGHSVTVWNRDPAKASTLVAAGATLAPTPRAASAGAEVVIAMVRDNLASRAVWLDPDHGALAGMSSDAIAIESSTLTVEWVRELGEIAMTSGIALLDAPVAGSRPQAEAAQLIYFVGGDESVFAKVEPVLKAMGGLVHHAGPLGSGAGIKLMVNALFGIQLAAMGELIGFSTKMDIDAARAIEILGATPVCSPAAKIAAGAMLARNFAPMFPIELVEKDFGYVIDEALSTGAEVPMSSAARQVFAEALARGYGGDNITGVVKVFQEI